MRTKRRIFQKALWASRYLMLAAVISSVLLAVALLYPPCLWFGRLKARRRDLAWLSYL